MKLFMHELFLRLDLEDRNWRNNTVLIWDGAGYHKSEEMLEFLEERQAPVLQLAPYGYLLAPCELLFGAFKSKQMNPDGAPSGKSKFNC